MRQSLTHGTNAYARRTHLHRLRQRAVRLIVFRTVTDDIFLKQPITIKLFQARIAAHRGSTKLFVGMVEIAVARNKRDGETTPMGSLRRLKLHHNKQDECINLNTLLMREGEQLDVCLCTTAVIFGTEVFVMHNRYTGGIKTVIVT